MFCHIFPNFFNMCMYLLTKCIWIMISVFAQGAAVSCGTSCRRFSLLLRRLVVRGGKCSSCKLRMLRQSWHSISLQPGRAGFRPHRCLCRMLHVLYSVWTSSSSDLCDLPQVLEEMERDLGISYPSALPPDERRQYQRDVLSLYKHNQDLNASLQSRQEELMGAERTLTDLEDEKTWLQGEVDWDIFNQSLIQNLKKTRLLLHIYDHLV